MVLLVCKWCINIGFLITCLCETRYRGFGPSVLGIIVYRGLYFGMYDSIKPVVLTGSLEGNFLASFLLGWCVTTGAGIASYPLDTVRRRMMMTS